MATLQTPDPILKRFRPALDGIYGSRLDHMVLFGSRARGGTHRAQIPVTISPSF
jgi:hypothetical protein